MAHRGRTQHQLLSPTPKSNNSGALWKALVSGLAGGLAASWVMTQYQVGSQKLISRIESKLHRESAEQSQSQSTEDNATTKIANRLSRAVAGHDVPQDKKQLAGNLVHYGTGILFGGAYGVLRHFWAGAGAARGVAYGAAIWATNDELAVPALGVGGWWPEYPLQVHAQALAAHVVYSSALDAAQRTIHRLLNLIPAAAEQSATFQQSERRTAAAPRRTSDRQTEYQEQAGAA